MKKYIIILTLYLITFSYYADDKREITEWNAREYEEGNFIQFQSSLFFLQKNKIKLSKKKILDVACGTGKLAHFLIENSSAELVHGFDSSEDMIYWAKQYHTPANKNISFRQCCVEDFSSEEKYDLATVFFSFHWFKDKQKALNTISASLKDNGELFGTFSTTDVPQNPGITIIKKMIEEWGIKEDLNQALARSVPTTQELKTMVIHAHFDIIKCEVQENEIHFADRKDIEKFGRPILMSRPFIQNMIPEQREKFFQEYINRLSSIFKHNQAGGFTHIMHMTIIHARKKPQS